METTYDVSTDGPARARGQDVPRRRHRLAVDGLGLGPARQLLRAVPPRLVTRPLPGGDRAIAAGDRAGAERALDYLWERRQQPDGCFPQNSNLDGSAHWPNLQLDEVAYPIVMTWQLGRTGPRTWRHVERAAGRILDRGPASQERWENAEGYSPATIAASVAALVLAAEIAERNDHRPDAAARLRAAADEWEASVDERTLTTNGPLEPHPYYLRLSVDGDADAGTRYTIGDGGPTVDQRTVVDPSFLELVRFGLRRPDDPDVLGSLSVVDRELKVSTPNGDFWHRYNHDGYGELPEQVWDENPPSGQPGYTPGEGTLSSTPLAWTHAQFVRLAWSIDAGRSLSTPELVRRRYADWPTWRSRPALSPAASRRTATASR